MTALGREDGLHVAIVMDGNGRWARARGLPRSEGHRKGADVVRAVIEAAPDAGIKVLTLYAFSSDNWARPAREVSFLMSLFRTYLRRERRRCIREGVRVTVIGRRDRLPDGLVREIERTEAATASGQVLRLRLAVDYSARDRILAAAARLAPEEIHDRAAFARHLGEAAHEGEASPDVDLLVRTGGEQRLSDFLLWECAYAELCFLDVPWPDFDVPDLRRAVESFHGRERRFGRVNGLAPAS